MKNRSLSQREQKRRAKLERLAKMPVGVIANILALRQYMAASEQDDFRRLIESTRRANTIKDVLFSTISITDEDIQGVFDAAYVSRVINPLRDSAP